ncbi:5-oxoprolinase subunit PxpA [soil metagenome]
MTIDLNADIGEGFPWDDALIELVTSGNVCLGGHAGSQELTLETANRWVTAGRSIGLHPGYPDRDGMGRRSPIDNEIAKTWGTDIFAQTQRAFSGREGWSYLKPHGAFYNDAAQGAVAANFSLDHILHRAKLPLLGLPDTHHPLSAKRERVRFYREGFADRRYTEGGLLLPRIDPGALIESNEEAAEQAVQLALSGGFDSLCLHGDKPGCVERAQAVRISLEKAGFTIAPFAL